MPALLPPLYFAACAAALAAAGWGARLLLAERRLDARLAPYLAAQPGAPHPLISRLPALLPALLSPRGGERAEIDAGMQLAGYAGSDAADRFARLRFAATAAAVALAMLASRIVWGGFFSRPLLLVLAGAPVFLGSRLALRLLAARRAREITAEFPFLLDLLLMLLQSGVSLDQCFRAIARDEGVALPHHARQMALLVADFDRGMDYEPALDRWAARVAVGGAQELASLFRQRLFQGIELTPALREFAREFSRRRIARAREAMGSVTVRMVVLMILFFMPALFVVLGGPPVVAIFDTLEAGAR